MTTTLGGTDPAYIIISPLADRDFGLPPISRMQITYRRQDEVDVWDSAANPFSGDGATFAAALSDKVVVYSDAEGFWDDRKLLDTKTDAVAVQWLGPSVLATGLRSGVVHLSDTRNGGSVARLRHSGAITGIRRVSAETLVICGMQDALAMYDLRMPLTMKLGDARGPQAKRRKHTHVPDSLPIVRYAFQSPVSRLGFDISTDAGVVAAVDAANAVQLYSLQSGRSIKTLTVPQQKNREAVQPLTQLRFTSTGFEDNYAREQLVACNGTELIGFQW